ncbi:MAG: Holliday junction resolvase RuvX [Synergistaceae bacterium]|nr:Holliday junction resolvase RuvX [Synergistaceae bacterium]
MSRVLALDIGSVRIGAAVSDPSRIIAQGLGVWQIDSWREELDSCVKKFNPAVIVLGLPLRTDGKKSEAAERVLTLQESLKADYPEIEFITWDERFTTVIAQKMLIDADISRRQRRKTVDKIAAVLILESWLEANK